MIRLTKKGTDRLRSGHPWIYRSDLAGGEAEDGEVVEVGDEGGRSQGFATWSAGSQIALRVLSRGPLEADWLRRRLGLAVAARGGRPFGRLVHGDGDNLPGLVVDRYGPHLSLQLLTPAMERRRAEIVAVLQELLRPTGIVERSDVRVRELEGLPQVKGVIAGSYVGPTVLQEGEVRMQVDLLEGQKTGAFLDQRENHVHVGGLARGRALDLFSYIGGFALQLARRAESTLAVEVSGEACARIRENARLSGVNGLTVREGNAFDVLRELNTPFDTIVCDPPAFTKTKEARAAALRGYKDVNLRCIKLLAPGGTLATFTCSQHVDADSFEAVVVEAARDARRAVQVLERRGAASDHPERLGVPETRYLKGLILRAI